MGALSEVMRRGSAAKFVFGGLPPSRAKEAALSYVGTRPTMLRGATTSPAGSSAVPADTAVADSVMAGLEHLGKLATRTLAEAPGQLVGAVNVGQGEKPAMSGFNPGYNWFGGRAKYEEEY